MFWKILSLVTMSLLVLVFFRQLDSAIEVGDLKTQINFQKNELVFLQRIINESFKVVDGGCSMPVNSFESLVSASSGWSVYWQIDEASVGPYKIIKDKECIKEVRLIGL